MKVKKWMLGLITFAAMVVICAVCAGAERYGDFQYSVLEDDTVEITDYNGSAETVDIPKTIDGKSVTEIGWAAFYGCTSLKSITIPNSVTEIGSSAFSGCASLTSITIPNSVTEIGNSAFEDCTSLTSMMIPDSVMEIGSSAFSRCTSLTSITIPDSVTSIGDSAFNGCTSLTSITIPNSVTSIRSSAFSGCESLISVTIPSSVASIGSYTFSGCTSLKSITIPNSVTFIYNYAFMNCTSLKSIIIPNSVTGIDDYAFCGCTSLTSITIPDSVTSIGVYAFEDCTSLTSITIPDSVSSIGVFAFKDCTSLTAINVATGNQNYVSVNGVLYNKGKTAIICYPAGKKDKNYKIPYGVRNIGDYTFEDCISLTSITIPDSVTEIGWYAFSGCTSLTNITIPDSVTSIGVYAFSGCTSLTSITIPNGVTEIGSSAFSRCTSLTAINVATGNQNYVSVNGVLYNKGKTAIICYPAGKKDKNYKMPDGVTSIRYYAFYGCTSLTAIDVEVGNNNYTSVDGVLFNKDKTELICYPAGKTDKSYNIPDSVTSIGDGAFQDCTSLTSITIPDSVTSIGYYAFRDCTSLTSITIPDSVTSIGRYAFGYYYDNGYKKIDNFKINCYTGTEGEKYAIDNGFDYVLLDKLPTLPKVSGVKLGGRAADALRINWTKNTCADGYIVEMYQGGKWVRVAKITNNSTTTFRKAGLKAGTVYKFRVKAYKMYDITAVYGAYSATMTARTNPSVIKGAKLGGRAADALRINWTKNASADGYIVEMYQGNKWIRVAKITNSNTTTFRKAGLKASTVYKFRVRAYKMSGSTALYGNYSATVTARTNPSTVNGVKIAGKAKDALRVNWTKNTSAQGYIVEMYKGGKWVRVAKIANSNTTTFRKAGLAKNTTYKFRVRAYHMSGKTALYGNYGSVSGKTLAK